MPHSDIKYIYVNALLPHIYDMIASSYIEKKVSVNEMSDKHSVCITSVVLYHIQHHHMQAVVLCS